VSLDYVIDLPVSFCVPVPAPHLKLDRIAAEVAMPVGLLKNSLQRAFSHLVTSIELPNLKQTDVFVATLPSDRKIVRLCLPIVVCRALDTRLDA